MARGWKTFLTSIVMLVACLASFAAGVAVGPSLRNALGVPTSEDATVPLEFRVLLQVWSLVNENFVFHKSVDPKVMADAGINAMLATLHDTGHTRFLTADQYHQQQEQFQGQFYGIGATIATRDHHPAIDSTLPNSPAEKAGLRANDIILAIDGHDTTDMSLDDTTRLVKGPKGTKVVLRIGRIGQSPMDVPIVRDVIPIVNVHWQELPGTDVADIAISEFSEGTDRRVSDAVKAAQAQGARRFIVDVRDNPGGLLDQSVGVASIFLQHGVVLIQEDAKGHRDNFRVSGNAVAPTEPIIVLVNKGTASAAEIFAGAIQDNHRGTVIGTTTYGTGTVMSTYLLTDGSALLLGTQEWLTPDGQTIKDRGITPDQVVALPDGAHVSEPGTATFPGDGMAAMSGADSQLAAALRSLAGSPPAAFTAPTGLGGAVNEPATALPSTASHLDESESRTA